MLLCKQQLNELLQRCRPLSVASLTFRCERCRHVLDVITFCPCGRSSSLRVQPYTRHERCILVSPVHGVELTGFYSCSVLRGVKYVRPQGLVHVVRIRRQEI